eukprot:gene203-3643_t
MVAEAVAAAKRRDAEAEAWERKYAGTATLDAVLRRRADARRDKVRRQRRAEARRQRLDARMPTRRGGWLRAD